MPELKLKFGDPGSIAYRDSVAARGGSAAGETPTTDYWRMQFRDVIAAAFLENPEATRADLTRRLYARYSAPPRHFPIWQQEVRAALNVLYEGLEDQEGIQGS
jgi:hypothetical protein